MNPDFNKNEDRLKHLCTQLQQKGKKIMQGGGKEKVEAQRRKGKLTARERITHLLDKESSFLEIGLFAGYEMYREEGGCPAAGVVAGVGRICGRQFVIVANDATVKSGAWFPITAKKNLRVQEIAMENRLPIVYLVDSAGVFLPMQEEIFPDKEHFGRQFRNNAKMSAMGIVQIAVIMGNCVAGGAYLPIMSDEALIVDKTGSVFLAGSYLVRAAVGERIDNESLGGASTHCEISGVTDNKFPDDPSCLTYVRRLIDKIGDTTKAGFNRIRAVPPKKPIEPLYGLFPVDRKKPYDMLSIIEHIVDGSEFDQYKPLYGKTLLCGYARVDGWAIGIVANQRKIVKTKKGEMQMGGVIYSDSADKAARFVMNCNQRKIPILFIQDVSGFMVGSKAEHGGIIKDGAKMVNVVANSTVPKFTLIVGNSYGAGNYAMCGKAYDPRFIYAWPTAQIAVMSGASAAKTLLQIKIRSLEKQDKKITEKEKEKLLKQIIDQYNDTTTPYYAASRLWVDAIIDPAETRNVLATSIEAADHAPVEKFCVGMIQT